MIHVRDVRAKIAAVLNNEISVEDFARWIMSNSWNMHKDSSPEAVDLVSSIHLLLAERADDTLNPNEFRNELQLLLKDAPALPHHLEVRVIIYVDRVSQIDAFPISATARRPVMIPEVRVLLPV